MRPRHLHFTETAETQKAVPMFCPVCETSMRRFGRNRNGSQRYRCDDCRTTYTDDATRPHDGRRVAGDKMISCVRMLMEGNSIRGVERLTGVAKRTIIDMVVENGQKCAGFLASTIKNVPVSNIQADEIWGFVRCKEKTRLLREYPENGVGDAYCYTALERHTKLLVAWHLGKRCQEDTQAFAHKLRAATTGSFQLTTDGWLPYRSAIPETFGQSLDYAVIIKDFVNNPDERRYSPPEIIHITIRIQTGDPERSMISTSHVERHNRTLRMQIRRLTRLTDAHSKKWENHEAALAFFIAYYNFVRVHSTIKTTPAVEAGLTDHVWSMGELLAKINAA
jgi:transposase-like protein/IS1 family transposase